MVPTYCHESPTYVLGGFTTLSARLAEEFCALKSRKADSPADRRGDAQQQIASRLGISVNTVSRHRQNILARLSVGNSIEAYAAATAMKLL